MEELNKRLNCGNAVYVSQIISRLVQHIKHKKEEDEIKFKEKEIVELKFLKEKCVINDPSISEVASKGILCLVNNNVLQVQAILSDFMSIVTTTSCPPNITYLINNLMLIEVKNELASTGTYKNNFNLRLPQHPFIIMLNENPKCCKKIYSEILFAYENKHEDLVFYCNALYKPLYLHVMCDPENINLINFKQQLWSFLLQNRLPQNIDIVTPIVSWIQINSRNSIVNTNKLLSMIRYQNMDPHLLILWQISCLYYLVLYNEDPREAVTTIIDRLQYYDNPEIFDSTLLILSKIIPICSSVYLDEIMDLTKCIIRREPTNIIIRQTVKAAILQWIANPSILIENALITAKKIFDFIEESPHNAKSSGRLEDFMKFYENILTTNNEVYLSLKLSLMTKKWSDNNDLLEWLEKIEQAPVHFLLKIIHFLYGLFLSEFNNSDILLRIFALLMKCCNESKRITSDLLTIILYKLSNTDDSKLHFELLKALPKMGVVRENVQKIINTIQALNKGLNSLQTFSITLMFNLWKIDNRCYSYLENLLTLPYNSQSYEWEFYIVRAQILKEICSLKPELYGKEMVAHLSKILNECNHPNGDIACGLALEGITYLCKVEIIDVVTTWNTISPMFQKESRINVIKSLCTLISEIPHLSYTEQHPNIIEDVLRTLWHFIKSYDDCIIWEAALNALSEFDVDQIKASMPIEYFGEETEEKETKTPNMHWIKFLNNCNSNVSPVAVKFLVKMVKLEVAAYLKYVYQVKGNREPVNYSYLPVNSIVRCIGDYVKSRVQKWGDPLTHVVDLECLRILSHEYSKPLPPLDWCFLQELIHDPQAKNTCISIAAHQVILSGTARRLIENYIQVLTQNPQDDDELIHFYTNLKHISNSIQPGTLKPFLEVTYKSAIDKFNQSDKKLLDEIFKYIVETIQDKNIQDTNKSIIIDMITNTLEDIDIFSELFDLLLTSIVHFPMKKIDMISSPKSAKNLSPEWFKKAIRIRCHIAMNASSSVLNGLNDLIDIGYEFEELTPYMFEEFVKVYKKHIHNTDCALWLSDFFGQIEALIADKGEKKKILFQCDVLILMVVTCSGYFTLLEDFTDKTVLRQLFPQAIANLLDVNHWSICTTMALEWLHFMYNEEIFSTEYKDMFKQSVQALRHDNEFQKNMNWIKYINIEC